MVNRQTLTANTNTNFEFDNVANEFIVKNFTSDYIVVCHDTFVEANGYKIPSMTAQKIKCTTDKLVVKASASGEVEIDA